MSDQTPETGIEDEDLPEDLQPSDDNPLAQPLDEDDEQTKSREELDVMGGKTAEEGPDPEASSTESESESGSESD